jgi:hypothetical protein
MNQAEPETSLFHYEWAKVLDAWGLALQRINALLAPDTDEPEIL